jgi:hypothetical protein
MTTFPFWLLLTNHYNVILKPFYIIVFLPKYMVARKKQSLRFPPWIWKGFLLSMQLQVTLQLTTPLGKECLGRPSRWQMILDWNPMGRGPR